MPPSILTSNDNRDNGALAKLDLSGNNAGSKADEKSPDFIRPIGSMLKTNRSIKEINLAGNNLNAEATRIFSQDIHDNGALSQLDISRNNLGNEEKASIKQTCAEKSITCVC